MVEQASIAPPAPEASVVYDSGELIVLGTTFTCLGASLAAEVELEGTQLTVSLRETLPTGGCLDERRALSFRLTIENLRSGGYGLRVLQVGGLGSERPVLIDQPIIIPVEGERHARGARPGSETSGLSAWGGRPA